MSRWMPLTIVFALALCPQLARAEANCLERGTSSLKAVLDAIYEDLGSPEMTDEAAGKIDRQLFRRDNDEEPALARDANISWVDFDASIVATVQCVERGRERVIRVRWRPDEELEEIDMDAVLTAD